MWCLRILRGVGVQIHTWVEFWKNSFKSFQLLQRAGYQGDAVRGQLSYTLREIWNFDYRHFFCHVAIKLWLASCSWQRNWSTQQSLSPNPMPLATFSHALAGIWTRVVVSHRELSAHNHIRPSLQWSHSVFHSAANISALCSTNLYCAYWLQAGYISWSSVITHTPGQVGRSAGKSRRVHFIFDKDFC